MSRRLTSMGVVLLVGVILGAVASTEAGSEAKPPSSTATGKKSASDSGTVGVCEYEDWACVSECISEQCADDCLKKRCQRVLDALVACSSRVGCEDAGTGDTRCVERNCKALCRASF